MASAIDPTLGGDLSPGVPVRKPVLQEQLQAAKDEIEALQNTAGNAVQPNGTQLLSAQANNGYTENVKNWKGTQSQYDALGTYDGNTVYDIVE